MLTEIETEVQDQSGTDTESTEATEDTNADSQGSDEEQLEASTEEQDEESQDPEEEESEEDTEEAELSTPKEKSGNFDWKKINEKIGSPEVERAFKESQRTISRYSQENSELRKQVEEVPALREEAENFRWFDQLVRKNPALRSQIQAAISGGMPANGQVQNQQQYDLPPGVNPEDPLVPMVVQQQQLLQRLLEQSRQAEEQQQHAQLTETFRQGLIGAKDRFKQLVGRDMSEKELRSVAEKMRATNVLQGAEWVPSLFVDEIQKSAQRKFFATRKEKKNLPKSPGGVRSDSKTAKPKSVKEAFDEAWEREYGNRD